VTRLRCGGKFNDSFIANFLQIVIVKKFKKNRPVFDEVMPKILQALFFPDTVYIIIIIRILRGGYGMTLKLSKSKYI